jgi:hypothetical protein
MTDTVLAEQPSTKVDADAILRPAGVEKVFPVTANHLAQLRYRGTGPRYYRQGHLIVYRAGDVRDWLLANCVEPKVSA